MKKKNENHPNAPVKRQNFGDCFMALELHGTWDGPSLDSFDVHTWITDGSFVGKKACKPYPGMP